MTRLDEKANEGGAATREPWDIRAMAMVASIVVIPSALFLWLMYYASGGQAGSEDLLNGAVLATTFSIVAAIVSSFASHPTRIPEDVEIEFHGEAEESQVEEALGVESSKSSPAEGISPDTLEGN